MRKSKLRKKLLKIRKINRSKNFRIDFKMVIKILKKNKRYGKMVGGYYPFNDEIDDLKILRKLEKFNYKISLPKIKKKSQMDFYDWSTQDPLFINKYGIPEPVSNKIKFPKILFVPLLGFDKSLNRIGYGGGFYDRYIKRIKKKIQDNNDRTCLLFSKNKKCPS